MKVRVTYFLLICMLLTGCGIGLIDCPTPTRIKLHKKAKINYQVIRSRERLERERGISRAELRELTAREAKTVTAEEWDCPKPGMNRSGISRKIYRRNLRRMEEHYRRSSPGDTARLSGNHPKAPATQ